LYLERGNLKKKKNRGGKLRIKNKGALVLNAGERNKSILPAYARLTPPFFDLIIFLIFIFYN
jgi:hypothetical protein